MSDADEKNSEELSFDFNPPLSMDAAETSFDFGSFADESGGLPTDLTADATTVGNVDGSGDSLDEVPPFAASDFPDSSSDTFAEDSTPETTFAVVETPQKGEKKKGGKREKAKKVSKEGASAPVEQPRDLGYVLSLSFAIGTLLVLCLVNVLIFWQPGVLSITRPPTALFVGGVNAFGLVLVGVPFLFWKFRTDEEKEKNLQLFDVLLGIALMAIVIGVLCFWKALNEYDFKIKAARPAAITMCD